MTDSGGNHFLLRLTSLIYLNMCFIFHLKYSNAATISTILIKYYFANGYSFELNMPLTFASKSPRLMKKPNTITTTPSHSTLI